MPVDMATPTNELLIGGPADGKPDSAFDPKALKKGTKEEAEHTDNPAVAKEIAKDHLVENPGEYSKEAVQRRCNLLARRHDRPEAELMIDKLLEGLGMERDDAGAIKDKAFTPRTYECPECHAHNARHRRAHEDTSMECVELKCPDCGFFCEDIDDLPKSASAKPPITGPEAIAHALAKLDLAKVEEEHKQVIRSKKVSKRPRAVQVLNVLEGLKRNNLSPSDLMIHTVPVIPPVFRPFSVVGNTFVPGDANELYRDLMHLRDGYKEARELLGDAGTQDTRLSLYDAVKALYGYGEPTSPKTKQRGVAGFLKQVSGVSPKFSFFQRKMLSKPMDSVSRGTITVDPDLSLDEVGVPEDMAWTMYKPYVQRRLTTRMGMSSTDALTNVTDRTDHARKALLSEMSERPVIYTRAPSWHKFNVLAGHPKLIEGNTIALCPLVTTGQNADFDGDAMNLHVPSHPDSVKEAYEKLMPSKMLFSIRDQDKVMPLPKHEQILGLFTAVNRPAKNKFTFASEEQAVSAIRRGQVSLSDDVEVGHPSLPA
jgi:DNA-directed RNA polymerase beta' subunit